MHVTLSGSKWDGRTQIAVLACVLAGFAMALPLSSRSAASGVSTRECSTLGNASPASPAAPLSLLERCSSVFPADVELLADLGGRYEATDPARSEAAYRRALAIDPGYADLRLRLGGLLMRRGAKLEARREAEAALRVQPNRRALLDLLRAAGEPPGSAR